MAISAIFVGWAVVILLLRRRRWYFISWLTMAVVSLGYSAMYLLSLNSHLQFSQEYGLKPKWDQQILALMMVTMVLQVVFSALLFVRLRANRLG